MTEEEQKAEVVQNPDTEKLWKRFKSYFWVLFVLHLIPKGFSGIETTTNEQATTLFFVALGITLLVALGMVINVGLHAYLFSKKKVYALLGLLGLWWAGVVGIALAYFAVLASTHFFRHFCSVRRLLRRRADGIVRDSFLSSNGYADYCNNIPVGK